MSPLSTLLKIFEIVVMVGVPRPTRTSSEANQSYDVSWLHFNRLLAMRERESRALANAAVKLRLTNQARYTPTRAQTQSRAGVDGAPWQFVK